MKPTPPPHELYLGQVGTELRLRLSDERTADLIAEIASHLRHATDLDSSIDPVDELGPPSELAAELIAAEPTTEPWRRTKLAVYTATLGSMMLVGLMLIYRGSPIDLIEVGQWLIASMLFVAWIPRLWLPREHGSEGRFGRDQIILAVGFGAYFFVSQMLREYVLPEFPISIPAARSIGVAMIVAAIPLSFLPVRRLQFEPETGLTTDHLGRIRVRP